MLMKLDLQDCKPRPYLKNGHLQTIVAHLTSPKVYMVPEDRFHVALENEDYLLGHYFSGTKDIVICSFHGLSGDWTSDYMQFVAEMGVRNKCHVVLWNHRGAGQAPLSSKPYNSGSVEDVGRALDFVRHKFPDKKIVLVGFSLSGNIALAHAGGYKNQQAADLTLAINAPIDLRDASKSLGQGLNRIYDLRFVKRLSVRVQDKVKIPKAATLWDFDELYTAPASGFKNREHYYSECSSNQYISQIQTPTLILTAQDDPFVNFKNYKQLSLNPQVFLHVEKFGGHIGYISKDLKEFQYRWLKYYLDQVFSKCAQGAFFIGK